MFEFPRLDIGAKHWNAGERSAVTFLCLAAVVLGAACWHVPEVRRTLVPKAAAVGLTLDLVALLYVVIMLALSRPAAAFPLSLAFYVWAWLALPFAVLTPATDDLTLLWWRKLIDLGALLAVHFTFHQALGLLQDIFPTRRTARRSKRATARPSRRRRRTAARDHVGAR